MSIPENFLSDSRSILQSSKSKMSLTTSNSGNFIISLFCSGMSRLTKDSKSSEIKRCQKCSVCITVDTGTRYATEYNKDIKSVTQTGSSHKKETDTQGTQTTSYASLSDLYTLSHKNSKRHSDKHTSRSCPRIHVSSSNLRSPFIYSTVGCKCPVVSPVSLRPQSS